MISKIDRWIKGKTRWATILAKMVNGAYSTHYYDRRIWLNDWNDRQWGSKTDRWIKGKTRWATILAKMVVYKVNVVYRKGNQP